jgi:hypothetical protein
MKLVWALVVGLIWNSWVALCDGGLIVQTAAGPVQGFMEYGVRKFLGIPYAEPPIGMWAFNGYFRRV